MSLIINHSTNIVRQTGQTLDHFNNIFRKVVEHSMQGKVRAHDNWLLSVLPMFMTNRHFNRITKDKTTERLPSVALRFQRGSKHPGEIYSSSTREVYTVSLSVVVKDGDEEKTVAVCRLPITLGCVLCPLRNATMEDKMRAGLNPIAPLGCFLAKNTLFFTLIQERVGRSVFISYPDKGKVKSVYNLVSDKSVNHNLETVFFETKPGVRKTTTITARKAIFSSDAPMVKYSINLIKINASMAVSWREFNAVTVAFLLFIHAVKGVTDVNEIKRIVADDDEFESFMTTFFNVYFESRGARALVGHFYPNFVHDALSITIADASNSEDRLSVLDSFLEGETFVEDPTAITTNVDRMRKQMCSSDALFAAQTTFACLWERAFPDSPGVSKIFTFMDFLLSHCSNVFKCVFPNADLNDPSSVPPETYNIRQCMIDAAKTILDDRNRLVSKDSMELDIEASKAFFHRAQNTFNGEGDMISWSSSLSGQMDATVAKQNWKQSTTRDDTIGPIPRSSIARATAAAIKTASHTSKHGGGASNIETRMLSADAPGFKCAHDTPHNANIGTSESIASTAISSRVHPATFAFFLARNALAACDEQVLEMPTIFPKFVEDLSAGTLTPTPFKHLTSVCGMKMVNFILGVRDKIDSVQVAGLRNGICGPVQSAVSAEIDPSKCEVAVTIDGLVHFFVSVKDSVKTFLRLFKVFKRNPSLYDSVVNFNRSKLRIEIVVGGGKLMRPVINKDELPLVLAIEKGETDRSLEQLIVSGTLTFISPIEEGMFLIADHPKHHSFERATFVEIHSLYLYGLIAGPAPFSDNMQQSRLTLACAMYKQAIVPVFGMDSVVETGRFGMFGSLPSCTTQLGLITGEHFNPHGSPVVIMSGAVTNTYEDGIMINRNYAENMKYISLRVQRITQRNRGVELTTGMKYNMDAIHSHLEDDGMPKIGTFLVPGSIVFHGVSVSGNVEDNVSEPIPHGVSGFVIHKNTLNKEYYVVLAEYRRPTGGDKAALDGAQKGVITWEVDPKDMPRVMTGPHKGMVADIFFGILSIPSRMTPGLTRQINEGISAVLGNYRIDASPTVRDALTTVPTKTYFAKFKGKPMVVTVGITHHVMLPHISADKVQCVSQIKLLSDGTPTRGRSRRGALRDGNMEKDAQVTHGISWSHWDGFFERSDGCYEAICPHCSKPLIKVVPTDSDTRVVLSHYECRNKDCQDGKIIHHEDVVWLMTTAAIRSLKAMFASAGIDISYHAAPRR